MNTTHLQTSREFIEFFLYSARFCPTSVLEAMMTGRGGFIFRGQRDVTWPLLPTAHRPACRWHDFTPQGPARFKDADKKLAQAVTLQIGTQMHAELRSVLFFLEGADRMGINTPLNYEQFVSGHNEKLRPLMEASRIRRDLSNPSQLITELRGSGNFGPLPG